MFKSSPNCLQSLLLEYEVVPFKANRWWNVCKCAPYLSSSNYSLWVVCYGVS